MSIRGGFPEKCDFCGQVYDNKRYPVPEEAGAWACSECEARWRAHDERKESAE
jgi:ribosomal protein L37AE/L43A